MIISELDDAIKHARSSRGTVYLTINGNEIKARSVTQDANGSLHICSADAEVVDSETVLQDDQISLVGEDA